jgi:cytochrome c biogenesis protein CcdA/thiol-disulfide isomerase/thioredoxin
MVIGTGVTGRGKATPFVVVGSLGASIILFTFLLKASTALIEVPQQFWPGLSGGILVLFGLTLAFPMLWTRMPLVGRTSSGANKLLGSGATKKSFVGDVMIGAALGPIFSTCSPTYFVILATVLPTSFLLGTVYLLAYVAGLSMMLLLIAFLGQRFANRLAVASSSHGYLKRGIGVLFIILGLMIVLGYEKKLETKLLESGFFDVTKIEQRLLERMEGADGGEPTAEANDVIQCEMSGGTMCGKMDRTAVRDAIDDMKPKVTYREIQNPSGFLNSDGAPITIGEHLGAGKVVLIDFLTYSCNNCRAVIPHLNEWHEKYKDDGLVVIGIHAPEFAFEHERTNVEKALASLGVTFPVVMDNDFATWRAYSNRFWPHMYLINREGTIVYDHIGEGAYEETEAKIREALGL